jgi:hypothetical protein
MAFPLSPQPTWSIRDSSKVSDYLACPRLYFYSHILGWRPDSPAHDLHFGTSWHCAREYQLLHGYEDVQGAFNAFLDEYRKEFHESTDEMYKPKTPTAVLSALMKFAEERSNDLAENEVVILDGKKMTEISGTVPVDHDRVMYYRMDSIMRRKVDGKIFSWDHKSTQARYIRGRQWSEQFHLGIQNGTYTHCLYCMFPIEDVLGIEFCGTGFEYLTRGSAARPAGYHTTLQRVPAFKTPDQMNVWLWSVNDLLQEIDADMDALYHCKEEDPVLMSFRMNPGSCTNYRGCPFHDFCLAWSNPLQQCYEPPLGYKVEFWDPSAMETTVKKDLVWKS